MKTIFILLVSVISRIAQAGDFEFKISRDLFSQKIDHLESTVSFDGTTAQCLVDTGARFTLAKQSLVPTNRKVGETRGGGVSGKENVTDLIESAVSVGTWKKNGNVIGRKEDTKIPADCLLGNDFFIDRVFSIDFNQLKFFEEPQFQGTVFPLRTYPGDLGGHFGFTLELGGEKVDSLFDTGATDTVIDEDVVLANPENFIFLRELDVWEGSNQRIKVKVYQAKSIKFGEFEDHDVEVYSINLKYLQSKIPGIKAVMGLGQIMKRN